MEPWSSLKEPQPTRKCSTPGNKVQTGRVWTELFCKSPTRDFAFFVFSALSTPTSFATRERPRCAHPAKIPGETIVAMTTQSIASSLSPGKRRPTPHRRPICSVCSCSSEPSTAWPNQGQPHLSTRPPFMTWQCDTGPVPSTDPQKQPIPCHHSQDGDLQLPLSRVPTRSCQPDHEPQGH